MFFRRTHWYAAYAVAMILLFIVPTTYAAGRSLPGSPLYHLKTDILEPIEEALTFDSEKRIAVMIDNAENRLKEARHVLASNPEAAEEVEIASKTLSKKVEKARHSIDEAETTTRTEKIRLQKDLLTLVDSYVAILESDEDAEDYASTTEAMTNASDELEGYLRDSIQDFQEEASHDELATEVAEAVSRLQDRLDIASTDETRALNEDQRRIIEQALENTQGQLDDADLANALEILIFSDHEIDITEKIKQIDEEKVEKNQDKSETPEDTEMSETSEEQDDTGTTTPDVTEKLREDITKDLSI